MQRIADYHPRDTQGRPVYTFQSSPILHPGRLFGVQLIFSIIMARRGFQPLNTDPRNIGGLYINHLGPFSVESSRRAVSSSNPAACRMPLFREGHVPLMRRIPEGPLRTYGVRSSVDPPAGQVASGHSPGSTGAQVGSYVVSTGCIVLAKRRRGQV